MRSHLHRGLIRIAPGQNGEDYGDDDEEEDGDDDGDGDDDEEDLL